MPSGECRPCDHAVTSSPPSGDGKGSLINIDAGPQPEVVTTDQASDSDMVFGVFSMLGYRFAPRFADLGDQRFWRADLPDGTAPAYGPLEVIARNRIDRQKIPGRYSISSCAPAEGLRRLGEIPDLPNGGGVDADGV
ncbi:Tn3 family transposase [Streptosporangium canum]|uniref:Tn3 family transposase n=1 Tax=Streptosporangium canum TaxID=324952 RepID=UPI0034358535